MKILKILLAILLISCLFPMPYGYFNLVRIISMICFAIFVYQYYSERKMKLAITFCGLVILFQPLIKIHLGRGLWNAVDVIVAAFLFFLLFLNKKHGQ